MTTYNLELDSGAVLADSIEDFAEARKMAEGRAENLGEGVMVCAYEGSNDEPDRVTWCYPQVFRGRAAITAVREGGAMAICKYADPIDGAREGITEDEALAIVKIDPSLIYAMASK